MMRMLKVTDGPITYITGHAIDADGKLLSPSRIRIAAMQSKESEKKEPESNE